MGPPMLPRPIKPILLMSLVPSPVPGPRTLPRSIETQIVRPRCQSPLDRRWRDVCERGRIPFRRVVLVDDDRTHAFEEIVALHAELADAVFHRHRGLEIEPPSLAQFAERELERRRRFGRKC